ncbi:hypothetical protein [Enterococcus sp. 5H]|uniref:hypothetical protein n=1 Tax=Enterococcus sp. 5H TaxID=1229490 RepID=UPI0023040237|nr:hypothetical protein [Enterococcus sp. 5H]MDA9472642.1 hypothetical protein [Enterococcus sp. 5H]
MASKKDLKIRTLMADDMFTVLAFADKLELTDKIIGFLEQRDQAADVMAKQVGYKLIIEKDPGSKEAKQAEKDLEAVSAQISKQSFDIIGQILKMVMSNLKTIKTELNAFLADILEGDFTAEEVGKLPLSQYVRLLRDFFEVTKTELKELFTLPE